MARQRARVSALNAEIERQRAEKEALEKESELADIMAKASRISQIEIGHKKKSGHEEEQKATIAVRNSQDDLDFEMGCLGHSIHKIDEKQEIKNQDSLEIKSEEE